MPEGTVFIGNIPYDATESSLTEIFAEVGPVLELRLVSDRDTGKLKGYGFVEYADYATAMSAVRNLNAREYNGRQLRVDHAETMKGGGGANVAASGAAAGGDRRVTRLRRLWRRGGGAAQEAQGVLSGAKCVQNHGKNYGFCKSRPSR